MPCVRFEALPWDLTTPNRAGVPYGATLVVENTDPWVEGSYDNIIVRSKFEFIAGLQGRVREFEMSGNVAVAAPESFTGSFSITMKPIRFMPLGEPPSTPPVYIDTDERDLCAHGGWFGEGTDSLGGYCYARFMHKLYTPGFVDEIGRTDEHYSVTISPPTLYLFDGAIADAPTGTSSRPISFGKTRDGDDCPVILSAPAMVSDGYGVSELTMQLGGPLKALGDPMIGAFTGSVTMTPSRWWQHDPGDGGGPVFNASTGARLRAAPSF